MSSWRDVRAEIERTISSEHPHADFDGVRRAKMRAIKKITGRELLVYAADFMHGLKAKAIGPEAMIDLSDKDGFDEITRDLTTPDVDVVIQSPGGYTEAAESLVHILRSRCNSVRFIVPAAAKSAATMMAMSGDAILMDDVSELGPIDPQFRLRRDAEIVQVPAQAAIDLFKRAAEELRDDPGLTPVWLPVLRGFGPSFLQECHNVVRLAEELVSGWLAHYMFKDDPDGPATAQRIAAYLNAHKSFGSHARRIGIDELRREGVKVVDLREDPPLRDACRALYYAIVETFNHTAAYKIFESTAGRALIRMLQLTPATVPSPEPRPISPAPKRRRRK